MKRWFAILILCVACLPLAGCFAAQTQGETAVGTTGILSFTEMEYYDSYGCSLMITVPKKTLGAVNEESFAAVFAAQCREELYNKVAPVADRGAIVFSQGQYAYPESVSAGEPQFLATTSVDSNGTLSVTASITAEGREAYYDYLRAGGAGVFGTDPTFSHRDDAHYFEASEGLYDTAGFELPVPIAAWVDEWSSSYDGTGALSALWNGVGVLEGLKSVVDSNFFATFSRDCALAYSYFGNLFNGCDGNYYKSSGSRICEWVTTPDGEIPATIRLIRTSQKTWAFVLIGIAASAAFAVAVFLFVKYGPKKKKEPPIAPPPSDPFGGMYRAPVDDSPFGKDYEDR